MGKRGPKKLLQAFEDVVVKHSQNRQRMQQQRPSEDVVNKFVRQQKLLALSHDAVIRESMADKIARLEAMKTAMARSRSTETRYERNMRVSATKERMRRTRSAESQEARTARLSTKRQRTQRSRCEEPEETRTSRRAADKNRKRRARTTESKEARTTRLTDMKLSARQSRIEESDKARAARLNYSKTGKRRSQTNESIEARTRRLVDQRQTSSFYRLLQQSKVKVELGSDVTTKTKKSRTANFSTIDKEHWEFDPSVLMDDSMADWSNVFHAEMWTLSNKFCPSCKERFPDLNLHPTKGVCGKCIRKCDKFTSKNNMDPGAVPDELSGLTPIEEILISPIVPIMSVYRLPLGQYGYRGNVINIPQDIATVSNILPRLPEDTNILVLRKKGDADSFRDFRVRRYVVQKALEWLKINNPFFKEISISLERIEKLPEEGEYDPPELVDDGADEEHACKADTFDHSDDELCTPSDSDTEYPEATFFPVIGENKRELEQKETEVDSVLHGSTGNPLKWPACRLTIQ